MWAFTGENVMRRNRRRITMLALFGLILTGAVVWMWWTEGHPGQERELRILVSERLREWFPEEMALSGELTGFIPRSGCFPDSRPPDLVLLHGLDEPGDIWDELVAALDVEDINGWEFRYPNDQPIDHSADLFAEYWPQLPADRPVILIGHSMGGLVIRDFVTRRRHPVGSTPAAAGPAVGSVILIGTPNHGSEWARLRVWLEVRELLTDIGQQHFSLFAGLRDGTGAAKIDLRPHSEFISALNARSWPDEVAVHIIGGVLTEPTPAMTESLRAIGDQIGSDILAVVLRQWWQKMGEKLGDGVVPVESLILAGQPEPVIFEASHRGLLVRSRLTAGPPPAVAHVLRILKQNKPAADPH
jgi:pimeloyl-ACP methyl ester carboxylesterase